MTIRRLRNKNFSTRSIAPQDAVSSEAKRSKLRRCLLETLEARQMLAAGPRLIGIQPNNSDLIENGVVRSIAPRELTFRFDDSQVIDANTLSGIRITRSGGDGSFGVASSSSDFGTGGKVELQLSAVDQGATFDVSVSKGTSFAVSLSNSILSVTLAPSTTAKQLVDAINTTPTINTRIRAKINGGLESTLLSNGNPAAYSPIRLTQTNDIVVQPGMRSVGENPDENEVTVRFAENLIDDQYRIEVFGFDDPTLGIVGLRNVGENGLPGSLLIPSKPNTRSDTVDFRLDLGPQVISVVPQPVVRLNGQLSQQRDTIVVYFDKEKLLVENDAQGRPTSRSVENPDFYQLIFTRDTIRNTDDGAAFKPISVRYNVASNTATLVFASDLDTLPGSGAGPVTYRLRIGSRETQPLAPTRNEAAANAITDFNTAGAVKVRFTANQIGEAGSGVQVEFVNSLNGNPPAVTVVGRKITVDLGTATVTAKEVVDAILLVPAATSLVSIDYEPGSVPSTVIGNRLLSYSPVTLFGLGSSFSTATNLGLIGSTSLLQSSLILSSSIDPEPFALDLEGASDDPAHRTLPQNLLGGFENHVNAAFGADPTAGITTIYYNFQTVYANDNLNNPLVNSITEEQKGRTREALNLWAYKIGVQFVETADQGVTIALGSLTGLTPVAATQIKTTAIQVGLNNTINFGVRIDKTFANSLIILEATRAWNNSYGEDYFRSTMASIGMVLGLEHAGDLPESTLMRLDPTFFAGTGPTINPNDVQLTASEERFEPIFPGNQDVLHGQYLHRPDGSDIDLYRFEVNLGDPSREGLFTLETYAQRLANSSELDTNLHLYKQTQAKGVTNFGVSNLLSVEFTAVRPGSQGNQFQIYLTQTVRGGAPSISVYPNAIGIDLNATPGSESTVDEIIAAIQSSSEASRLVMVKLAKGSGSTRVGGNLLTQNPIITSGGKMELISRNDDYFSRDSVIKVSLNSGVYFVGVSASGNDDYNAAIPGTGFGGQSQGKYEMRLTFRGQVGIDDAIQDVSTNSLSDPSVGLDGDGDGVAGGIYNFWFETRPLNRTLNFNAGGSSAIESRIVTVVGANGATRVFEFSNDAIVSPGRIRIPYVNGNTASDLASALANAITSQSTLGVSAAVNGSSLVLQGERSITVDPALRLIDVVGKNIFVDKSAGPNADGSLSRPFNNIAGAGVPNAFASALPGDIVRIVGNGGGDGKLETIGDNIAYEIGIGLLPGAILADGLTMDVPRGVTTMIDAGAIFKFRNARLGVGSSNLNINRSGAALQVLGAPSLLDASGNMLKQATGDVAPGSVYFTSWLDETIGLDTYGPKTNPGAGDWGGIAFRRDIDVASGRRDGEDEGIFLQYVNNADMRFGGGSVVVDGVAQTINAIQMFETRPTITYNRITRSADAAMSALPNSFEETNFNEPRFQLSGAFTSDYDRVGPEIHHNTLTNNSLNGLFIRVDTPFDGAPKTLTVPGRFDDIDIVHILSDNLILSGAPGGSILDSFTPAADLVSVAPGVGGTLLPDIYNYKLTFVDRNGSESVPSNATRSVSLVGNQTAIELSSLPSATGDFVTRRLYRSSVSGTGAYELIALLDKSTSTYLDIGKSLGGTLARDRLDVSAVLLGNSAGGTLAAGRYNYRFVMVDAAGLEALASNPTSDIFLPSGQSVVLTQLPQPLPGYVARRVYRSASNGSGPYSLIAELPNATMSTLASLTDDGSVTGAALSPESLAVKRPRLNSSLVIDPGSVLKLEGSRIEATFGTRIIAEGTEDLPIIFTSKLDDRYGAGGTFDTNNNGTSTRPSPRDWGGIYAAPTASLSVDHSTFAYAGGVTRLDGTFRAFNTIELQQADARIAHSVFENNADGFGGQGPGTRFGRLLNEPATIFVRGTQPTILGNVFRNNIGAAIDIDANSMNDHVMADSGRQTGNVDINPNYSTNVGPLIRENRFANNTLNGLKIRGDTLTTASAWDDTDIVHVVYDGIFVGNYQHEGGLRLQSATNESLVIKFDGYGSNYNRNMGAGITANGQLMPGNNRVGGTLHLVGQPGFPVIMTSLKDDTVGAGLRPDGRSQNDTNNDGIGSVPGSADWRGVLLDQYSNDRNVGLVLETEDIAAAAPGPNGSIRTAQGLGSLATTASSGSENLRLGFVIKGVLSQDQDVDLYSFSAEAGTEIWLDVDYTKINLDTVIELLDANGELIARSDNSTEETIVPALLYRSPQIDPSSVNPLPVRTTNVRTNRSGLVKEDGTTNVRDAGMRIVLPGSVGARGTFYFRLRSAGTDITNEKAGLSAGPYEIQLRLREQQEFAGSMVSYTDIRYSTNGVHLRGLPTSSPLMGEAAEDESVQYVDPANNFLTNSNAELTAYNGTAVGQLTVGNRPQYIGNLLNTANGGISLAGSLSTNTDVDFYRLDIRQQDIVGSMSGGFASIMFDMDYADGLNRPDTSINVFIEENSLRFGKQYRLIYSGDSSNIADDQARPLLVNDASDLSRGSLGTKDASIGPVALAEGTYLVAISSAGYQPRTRIINQFNTEPISSILRIVDEDFVAGATTALPPVISNFLPQPNPSIGPTGVLTSKVFNLGAYSAADQPATYIDYNFPGGNFSISIRDSLGVETQVATSQFGGKLQAGTNSIKIPLNQFAGQDGLTMIFRSTQAATTITNVIIGFAERGERVGTPDEPVLSPGMNLFGDFNATPPGPLSQNSTRTFSLATYTFADGPRVAFDYEVFTGQLDVFMQSPFGLQRIATTDNQNRPPNVVLLVAGSPQRASIDVSQYAGQAGLAVVFRARGAGDGRVRIGAVTMELADGSRIFSGEPNPTFVNVPVPSTTITRGAYQLEVRLGENFFTSNSSGTPTLTRTFDTNDRFAEQIAIVAPAGSDLTDGDVFEISDGGTRIGFEFSVDNVVASGNVPVRFTPADPAHVVARAIRDAINNPNVQSRLRVSAATSSGIATGTTGRDTRINLIGNAAVFQVKSAKPAGMVRVISYSGIGDRNVTRDQGQLIIQNSFVRNSRDYAIWSEPAARMFDPRDTEDAGNTFGFNGGNFGGFNLVDDIQAKPSLAGTQAVRNLPALNNSVPGGLVSGVVIQNNVLEEGGLGGVKINGENPIWMITPQLIPTQDPNPLVNSSAPVTHFGTYIDDGDVLVIDADRTRLRFEFDDLAGGPTAAGGSTQVEGNGVALDSTIAWYRDLGGSYYQRLTCTNCQPFATNAFETMHALRDAILGSIFVSNGTTQIIQATIAQSLLGPDPGAPPSSAGNFYPEYFNRASVYLEGVTALEYVDAPGGFSNRLDIRRLSLGESPQPQTRIVNNTIIGKDGRASFNGGAAGAETNDTIDSAVQTWQGTSHNPLFYSDVGIIGDAGVGIAGNNPTSTGNTGGGNGGNFNYSLANLSSNRFVLRFEDGVSAQRQAEILASEGLEIIRRYDFINALLVRRQDNNLTIMRLQQLDAMPEIRYAEPDMDMYFQREPNDPQYPQQWQYDNQGQTGGKIDADIDAPEAWDLVTGSTQTVIAIIDSGVDYNHTDLRANMWVNPGEIAGDGIDNDANGYIDDIYGIDPFDGDSDPMDLNGHGTHVAGTTAAIGNNGRGVTGVNWNSKIMALKIGAAGPAVSFLAAVESLNYLVTMKTQYGINIVVSNNSYGGPGGSQAFQDAIQATIDVGILFVAAAGNNGTNNDQQPFFPTSFPLDGIVAVAATDHNDQLANFSNFGVTSVDIAAPGVDILSTTLGGGYGLLSGTSMASPHVAGVAALVASSNPGMSVAQLKSAILLGADPLPNLSNVVLSGARLNAAKSVFVSNAGLGSFLATSDVDIYQFKLGVGERAIIDIDSANSGLDSVLQIFDSRGVPQTFINANGISLMASDNDAAPGELLSLDSYADFTATSPGVYYAAVSSVGNSTYDPLSFANRKAGKTTGAYRITLSARHMQDFVITAEDASAYRAGETFTIHGVPDLDGQQTTGRTFEFVFGIGGQVAPGNIPINLNADWRFPDVARAIAKAINEGLAGGPAVSNAQQLPNGQFGTASPLPAVHARAMGGLVNIVDADFNSIVGDKAPLIELLGELDELGTNAMSPREIRRQLGGDFTEVNQGLRVFTRRFDGFITFTTTVVNNLPPFLSVTSLSHMGFGHDRLSTTPLSLTSIGDGTSEKFVVVKNAAWITGNNTVIVSPDENEGNNLDSLLPETGVLASRGASPTILNNVFFNLQSPVIKEESRRYPVVGPFTGGFAPYGFDGETVVSKPSEVILGGSVYQFDEPAASKVRFTTGIEKVPTNIPNTALDFNFDVADGVKLFVNAQAEQYLPASGSIVIDSGIDSLPERPLFANVKRSVGISVSPVIAPDRDAVGQLRVDDPSVAPPSGLGQNVFKDRGAFDRADFLGPTAVLVNPLDNDALGVDKDSAVSVVQLTEGVYSEFRIQLRDSDETFGGIGVNDDSVVTSEVSGVRATGASVVLFENGRLMVEGIDYRFAYDTTRNEIILTPLAGVWKNDRVYDILLNNKDRFVLVAPSGDTIQDGDRMIIRDSLGGNVHFEFESGFRLQIPQGLKIQVPLAGGQAGGVVDGDRFTITQGTLQVTFELDNNSNFLAGNIPVVFNKTSSREEIANTIAAAIRTTSLAVNPAVQPGGNIYLGAAANTRVNTALSALTQPIQTDGLLVPNLGAGVGGVTDGQLVSISDGRVEIVFEFDTDGRFDPANFRIDSSQASNANDIARLLVQSIVASGLKLQPRIMGSDVVHLGLSPSGSVNLLNSNLSLVGVSRTIADGEQFTISDGSLTKTFEFTLDANVRPGNIPIEFKLTDTQDQLGDLVALTIKNAGLNLDPKHINDGNIAIGGTEQHRIDASAAPSVGLFGKPGVATNTTLTIVGSLLLEVPPIVGQDLQDDTFLTLTNNGVTLVIEFDGNSSGPTVPGSVVVRFNPSSTVPTIVQSMINVINASGLGIVAKAAGGPFIDLGAVPDTTVVSNTSAIRQSRSNVDDGQYFSINNGTKTVTFEFENATDNDGFTAGRIPIFFRSSSTRAEVIDAMKAAIEASGLGLQTEVLSNSSLKLLDNPQYTFVNNGTSLEVSGVPGGATPIQFLQDVVFTAEMMRDAIIKAINSAPNTSLFAKKRGGNTLYVENAISIDSPVPNYFQRAIEDLAGNDLQPNRINNETQFSILMPGAQLDFGDAPDPVSTTPGRYPTSQAFDGARHVSNATDLRLGATITGESDGNPTPRADGDSGDDGVAFKFQGLDKPLFNRNVDTLVTVTLSAPGIVDGWIDFNADGDWTDPGENVLNGVIFETSTLTQTFSIRIPTTSPVPTVSTNSFARFRASSAGNLLPTGLALDGEVEDYLVRIVPGVPPIGTTDNYAMNEDQVGGLVTSDPTGQVTPGFVVDDGVLANDTSPDGRVLFARLLTPPQHVAGNSFVFNSDGTFSYQPTADYFGEDTFVYLNYVNLDVNENEILESLVPTTVTITIRPVNDVPTASNFARDTDEDVSLTLTQSDMVTLSQALPGPANEFGQTLRVSLPNNVTAQGGSVSLLNGGVIYTPRADFSGVDTFAFTLTDNGVTGDLADPLSVTRTVTITVRDKNDAPITTPKSFTIPEDLLNGDTRPVSFFLDGDTAGPPSEITGPNAQTLTFSGVVATSEFGGTVSFANGNVTYRPAPDFNGVDRFFYLVTDNGTSQGISDPLTSRGTVTVTVTAVDDAPRVVAQFGTVNMLEDAAERAFPLANYFFDPDVIPNDDRLTYQVLSNSNPSLVEPTLGANDIFIRPKPDQNGTAIIVFEASDRAGNKVTNTMTVIVAPVGDSPRLNAPLPNLSVAEDATIPDTVLAPTYFFDPDVILNGDVLTYTVTNSNPSVVTASIVNGTLRLVLVPDASGVATITVRAVDTAGNAIEDSFDITVSPVNDAPRVVDDLFYLTPQGVELRTTDARGTVTASVFDDGVLANDRDIEGNTFTASVTRAPTLGQLTLNLDGTFSYIPNPTTLVGAVDTFKYQAVDSLGAVSAEATVNITITTPPASKHQNPIQKLDVDADGFISPIDVLLIINFLNFRGEPSVSVIGLPDPPPYRDVNGDFFISPLDVLEVINFINRRTNGTAGGEGEGEGEGATVSYVGGNLAAPLTWSTDVMRNTLNNGTTMVDVPSRNPMENAVQSAKPDAVAARGVSVSEYLSSFGNDAEDEAEQLAGLATAKSSQEDHESLDSFFAEVFGQ